MNNAQRLSQNTKEAHLPFNDELFLSPIQKFQIYNKFPWKLLLHCLLVIGTTSQIFIVNYSYPRAQERTLYHKFLSEDDKTQLSFQRYKYLYTVNDIKEHLKNSIEKYNSISDESFEDITLSYNLIANPIIQMKVSYMKSIDEIDATRKYVYVLTNETLGPFDEEEKAKVFIKNVTSFEVNYTLQTHIPLYFADYIECQEWNIEQLYAFNQRAHFTVQLKIKRNLCDEGMVGSSDSLATIFAEYLWLHLTILILSTLSLILVLKYFYQRFKLYWQWKHIKDEDIDESIERKLYKAKFSYRTNKTEINNFYGYWSGIVVIGNVLQICACLLSIFDWGSIIEITELFVALGCSFSYLILGKYMGNFKQYSIIFLTLQHALPKSCRFILSVLPIYLGYSLFGYCVFWRSEYFNSMSNSIATLFALMNGDSVYFIMDDLSRVSFGLGQIYSYSFCIMFYVIVLNTFISIIGEAYALNKLTNYGHWIYSFCNFNKKEIQVDSAKNYFDLGNISLSDDLFNGKPITKATFDEIKTSVNREFTILFKSFYDLEHITRKIFKQKKDKDYFNFINDHLKNTFDKIDKKILFKQQGLS